MNAWGTNSFENESAQDWVTDFVESKDLSAVLLALQSVLELKVSDQLDPEDCAVAVAAAEVVAAVGGRPAETLGRPLRKLIESMPTGISKSVRELTIKAVTRVAEESPLAAHWQSGGMYEVWREDVDGLLRRLQG